MIEAIWMPFVRSLTADDWTKIEDAIERKKVQNRLAQRAHRKKFGRRKQLSKGGSSVGGHSRDRSIEKREETLKNIAPPHEIGTSERSNEISTSAALADIGQEELNQAILESLETDEAELLPLVTSKQLSPYSNTSGFQSRSHINFSITPSPFTDALLLHSTTAVAAMLANARLLSMDCSGVRQAPAFHISLAYEALIPYIPPALYPTTLQNTIPHRPYIDLLPFSILRDSLLQAGNLIDSKEMWHDLTGGDVRVWGNSPWETKGWELGERFVKKWWWLLNQSVLDEGNFWRKARGESSLRLQDVIEGLRSV